MAFVFIHGLGQNSSSWDKTILFMGSQNKYLCPDLMTLINNNDISYDILYRVFSEYCNNILEPLHLCGLSLGGTLALNYVIDYPKKVKSLVLIGTQDKMPKFLLKFQHFIFSFMPDSIFVKNGVRKRHFLQIINSMMNLDFTKDLKNISCATLIICGEKDIFNKKAAKNLMKNIQNTTLKIMKKSGHVINIDDPENLATEIKNFYKNY
jgi:pimeloyl-ACP methyl ester carboxylesterase